ncbi:MAG: twin-arginine translocase subunit TatC [Candidatus Anammoxibacter sp.]
MADTNNNESRFTFGEHLEELRKRIIYCVIAIIFCFVICWIFKETILLLAKRPHIIAMSKLGLTTDLQVISYQEGFYAYIKLCFISAIFFAYPIIVYQIWKFVNPGLYKKERKYFFSFIFISFLTFLVGILFGYFLLIPLGLQFLISILGSGVAPIITMGQYISFVFLLTIALGFVFQLPIIILLITKIGLLKAEDFIKWRKYAILCTFIISAIITPPDPFTQIMTAVPMIALYEAGILAAKPTKKRIFYFGSVVGGGSLIIFLFLFIFTHFSVLGTIADVKGDVTVAGSNDADNNNKVTINSGSKDKIKIQKGMCLETGINGKLSFITDAGVFIILDNKTNIKIIDKRTISVVNGQIYIKAPKMKVDFTVNTPNGNITTRFGEINIEALPFETRATVAKGMAVLSNGSLKKTVLEGRQGRITKGGNAVNVDAIIEWTK